MALRLGIRTLCKSCVQGFASKASSNVPNPSVRIFNSIRSLYSTEASSQLVKQVTTELKLEQKPIEDLSTGFTSFELTLDGALATLVRDHNQEKVKVQLDANSAVEAANDDVTEFDEDEGAATDDESDPLFVPTFTVTITKPSGDSMVFDCSFAEYGDYSEMGNAWESMQINSISVVPESTADVESVYSADTANLSDELYSSFVEYLKERKIDDKFANEILDFYRNFEHRCYVKHFLESVKNFVSS